jgi:hypothetical protein
MTERLNLGAGVRLSYIFPDRVRLPFEVRRSGRLSCTGTGDKDVEIAVVTKVLKRIYHLKS